MHVAIIGAGAAGLVALRHLKCRPDIFQPVVYELSGSVGGTWVYTDDTGRDRHGFPIHSSMYTNLRTNLPKEVMAFPDFPFPSDWNSFMGHKQVQQYLVNYARHHKLEQNIQLNTAVERVHPTQSEGNRTKWEVTVRSSHAQPHHSSTKSLFDAVIVCVGHYSDPVIPDLPGLSSFEGERLHSHDYRRPERFEGRTVLCLGAASSGQDIAMELSRHAKQVYLAHRKKKLTTPFPDNLQQTPGIKEVQAKSVRLEDDSELEIDTLILCTGYHYRYDFLTEECGVKVINERVTPLYKHVIHTGTPTLSFIGICKKVCPFPQFDAQAQFITASLDGSMVLPSREDMEADTEADYQRRLARGMPHRYAHTMGELQWDYNRQLASLANFPGLPKAVEKLYDHVHRERAKNLIVYRERNYELTSDEDFREVNYRL